MKTTAIRIAVCVLLLAAGSRAHGQSSGSIIGRVVTSDDVPVAGASIAIEAFPLSTTSDDGGRFVLGSVPAGERAIRVERIGFATVVVEGIIVSVGRVANIRVQLDPAPVQVQGITVEARRIRLIETDVSVTREIVLGRELRALPVDRIDEVIELTPGVSGGHFRGGRAGQEGYVIDGLEVKNQLEASAHGFGLELPPSALEQIEILTGGMSASRGSALSGIVSWVTRRGSTERWESRASLSTDQWAPESLFRGFTGVSASTGGPLRFIAPRSTIYIDVLAQGFADADPHARGLSCLEPDDADDDVAPLIRQIATEAPELHCPYTGNTLPHQRGDKLIGFARFDLPIGRRAHFSLSASRNRLQRELYTPEFRYADGAQLGQRSGGAMLNAGLDLGSDRGGSARRLTARAALVRLDRYLGALDPETFDGRFDIGGAGFGRYRFLGESWVRRPIDAQLAEGMAVPGYERPAGFASPFGAAGSGLFFTDGTPDAANWTRSDALSIDVSGEMLSNTGRMIGAGTSLRLYRIETYERRQAWLAGSSPSYARFFPATTAAWIDARLAGDDELNINVGVRLEAFRSGVRFRADRDDFLAPVIDPGWQLALMPRLGVALPLPGTHGRSSLRFNYGQVAQPPDFRFFLDTTIGDSLQTAIQRQGNPQLTFERARTYEIGLNQLIGSNAGASLTLFRKELHDLASAGLQIGSTGNPQYSTSDYGMVTGAELSVRGQWQAIGVRAGYTLQKATGIASGIDADSIVPTERGVIELPLAFDQRHAIDVSILYGQAAGRGDASWSAALTTSVRSGYPIDRRAAAGDTVLTGNAAYLPWTALTDLRLSRDISRLPGCSSCVWRVFADVRNLLGRDNIVALRSDSGRLAPSLATVQAAVNAVPRPAAPIPAESPMYSASIDFDGDGRITAQEFDTARLAAVLDRFDPSQFVGEARALRLGVEIRF